MGVRQLVHPEVTIEDDPAGLLLRFSVPRSTLGSVEILLSISEAETLSDSLVQALVFAPEPEA